MASTIRPPSPLRHDNNQTVQADEDIQPRLDTGESESYVELADYKVISDPLKSNRESESAQLQSYHVTKNVSKQQKIDNDDESITDEELLSLLTPELVRAVRWSMTLLLALLVPAALLTWATAAQYGLLLGVAWLIVGSLFLSLVYLVQMDVLKRPRRGVFPFFDAALHVLVREYHDFVDDWRQERLLLMAEPAYNVYSNDYTSVTESADVADLEPGAPKPRRKVKSFLFKIAVKPFLPMLLRGRRQRQQKKQDTKEARTSFYIPPVSGESV